MFSHQFTVTGNPELDQAMLDALNSNDLDKVEKALDACQRAMRRKEIAAALEIYTRDREHAMLHAALALWFERPEAQHEPRPGEGVKGDLFRWSTFEGLKLPTIRRDLVGQVLTGNIVVEGGQEFVCNMVGRLKPETKTWLIERFKILEQRVKVEREAVKDTLAQAFSRAPDGHHTAVQPSAPERKDNFDPRRVGANGDPL